MLAFWLLIAFFAARNDVFAATKDVEAVNNWSLCLTSKTPLVIKICLIKPILIIAHLHDAIRITAPG